MKKQKNFIQDHWFSFVVIGIVLFAAFLRFYNYANRWGLATDQAHDALVARYALEKHKLPQIGPFSSAGPFVMGPEWYYFIMIGTAIYPPSPLTPWVVLTVSYVFTVYMMILIGKELQGKQLAIILGLLTSVSTVQISQSFNLTNQAPISVLSAIALWAILRLLRTKNDWYLSLAAVSVAIGINTHLQGVLLVPLLIIAGIIKRPKLKGFFIALLLFCIPFIPLLLFDFTHNHYETRNMLQYYLHDQYKISLDQFGRRWSTYLGIFWPTALSEMIGGYAILGYLIIFAALVFSVLAILQKRISRFTIIFTGTFAIGIIFLRYTHTPLFSSYLMFINPFIFILVGWVIYEIIQKQMVIGYLCLAILLIGSLIRDLPTMIYSQNYTAYQAQLWENMLYKKYPNDSFALYDYGYITSTQGLALSLYLSADQRIADDKRRIGILIYTSKDDFAHDFPHLMPNYGYNMFDLESSTSAQLEGHGWSFINPSGVYKAAEDWYK